MMPRLREAIKPTGGGSLAKAFTRLSWAGFWLQMVFGSLPILMMLYYFAFSVSANTPRAGFRFIEYLALADLLILAFTTAWSYRYTRLARQIADPQRRPAEAHVTKAIWTGLTASAVGMLFSMIVILIESANLLFYFLKAPQAGIPVIQTSGVEAVHWISSVDMLSLMALILTLFAELVVLIFSLWLLFRTTLSSPEYPNATAG